jgi:hypothetical protein
MEEKIIKHIICELEQSFPQEKFSKSSYFLSGEKRKGDSRVYVNIWKDNQNIFIKYTPKSTTEKLQKEFSILKTLEDNKYFRTPRCIGIINNGIVMSFVSGNSLENKLTSEGLLKCKNLLKNIIKQIGLFHKNNRGSKNITDIPISPSLQSHIHIGYTHGDLDPFNLLIDDLEKLPGLIDWEDFNPTGIQELDALHFVIMSGLILNPNINHEMLYNMIFNKKIENPYTNLFNVYCKTTNQSIEIIKKLLPVYCDVQNKRLVDVKRDTTQFLYTTFKKLYYDHEII